MMRTGQSCKEASARKRSLANPKKKVTVGCWNVRTLYKAAGIDIITVEMMKADIDKTVAFLFSEAWNK